MKIKNIIKNTNYLISVLLISVNVSAATWEVNNVYDENSCEEYSLCDLRGAILKAVAGDSINFVLDYNTNVEVNTPLTIDIPLTINGIVSSSDGIVINGQNNNGTIFHITSSGVLNLNNLSITKGGAINQNLDFDSHSNQPFGAIYLENGASLNTTQVSFTENYIAIANNNGKLNISQTDFFQNEYSSYNGATIYSNVGEVTISDSDFSLNFGENKVISYFEDLNNAPSGTVNKLVIANSNFSEFGSIYIGGSYEPINLDISNSTFSNFHDTAIVISSQELIGSISNSKFLNNEGDEAGAINLTAYKSFKISKSVFTNNKSHNDGGAISANVYAPEPILIMDSTFNMNKADDYNGNGGAIHAQGAIISQSTFYQNTAAYGGAISVGFGDIAYSTFSKNNASNEGRILFGGEYLLESSILLDNFVGGEGAACVSSSGNSFFIRSFGGIMSNDESCVDSLSDTYPYDILISDTTPVLEELADNGGLTPTISLVRSQNNPAIDAIPVNYCENYEMPLNTEATVSKDQRGMDRPQGAGCDIGAYELDVAEVPYDIQVKKISNLTQAFQNVDFNDFNVPFGNPVVIAGVVTTNGIDAGTVRIKDVESNGFSIRFQEFDKNRSEGESSYAHNLAENLSVMVSDVGVKTLVDGTVIETMKFTLGDDVFDGSNNGVYERKQINYSNYFATTPIVLCTIQTFNGSQAVFTQLENINSWGFTISLVEQEFNNQQRYNGGEFTDLYGHAKEEVGCVAIGLAENIDWASSQKLWLDENIQPVMFGGSEVHLQEDLSADSEVTVEFPQKVELLWIEKGYDAHLFGSSSDDSRLADPATLRQCAEGNRGCDILKGNL